MKNVLFTLLLLPLINLANRSPEQQATIDSLKLVIKTATHDSIIINSWIAWDNIIYKENPELDFIINCKIDSLCNINIDKKPAADERYFFLSEKASCLNNIGVIYIEKGDYAKAIEYYIKSLKIREEMRDKNGIAISLNNIGVIYIEQDDHTKAIDYFTKSLKINEEKGNKKEIAGSLNNIGGIYADQNDHLKAIDYFSRSLKIREEIGDKKGTAQSFNNIGEIYKDQGDYAKAMDYYIKGLKIREEIGYKLGISKSLNNIGLIHEIQDHFSKSKIYGLRSLKIAKEIGVTPQIKYASKLLWNANRELGNYKESLTMHELYVTMLDSIGSEKKQKEIMRQEFKYNYEKKAALDSLETLKEKRIAETEYNLSINEEKNIKLWIGLIASLLIILLILTSFILLKKSEKERQKLFSQLEEIKKQQPLALNLKAIEFELNKEKLEAYIRRELNKTDWSILKIITEHPEIKNEEIGKIIFKSKDGVGSSLRRMYQYFDIPSSRYRKISLALKVSKLSVKQAA